MTTSGEKKSNRGGVRPGSGRPKEEKTVQVRVPVGAVDAVRAVIDLYKKTGLKPDTEIKKRQVDWTDELKGDTETSKLDSSPADSEIKPPHSATDLADAIMLISDKGNRKQRRAIIAKFGGMEKAAAFVLDQQSARGMQ